MNGVLSFDDGSSPLDHEADDKIISMLLSKSIKVYNLEDKLSNHDRCVRLRQKYYLEKAGLKISQCLTQNNFDYGKVFRRCCENVIGFVTVPVGLVGPITLNGECYYVPLATTEGCLVASTNRGARCVAFSGIKGLLVSDGMTRAPVFRADSVETSVAAKHWIEKSENFNILKTRFDSTSSYARLTSVRCTVSGIFLYVRFKATTGDAMGMNMVSKGTEAAVSVILAAFPTCLRLLSLSGNLCTDKKASSLNWIEGRGKSVVCEAVVPGDVVRSILNVSPEQLVELAVSKNLVGSAMACTIGGQNANAANVVAAVFAATGQDLAQVVESSQCLTYLEMKGSSLYISCTMPCIEVGTTGGGTGLPAQSSCLEMIKLDRNPNISTSSNLALVVCATVLCCELSLLAALCNSSLVSSHMKYNRAPTAIITCRTY